LINIPLRIKYFGNEANPDSLKIEFAAGHTFTGNRFFSTSNKSIHCNPCQSKDKIAPVIRNCPTQMVRYPVSDVTDVDGMRVAQFANIQVSDNCALADVSTYPHQVFNPKKGQVVDYHTVTYDEVGHKSVCNFKAQFVAAPCNLYTKPILQYLGGYEQTIIAAAGQTCKVATWEEPTVNENSSFNPVKITSNYPSGHCFPIGTTQVWYTATDSCGKTDRASFNVTVRSYNAPDMSVNITANTTTYLPNSVVTYKIIAKNLSGATFSNVKIKYPFPAHTAASGAVVPSVGTWNETCPNGVQCYEWTIPTLGMNQTATLTVPLRITGATNSIETTAKLIRSTPTDVDASNNIGNWRIDPYVARLSNDNQQVTVDIKSLSPNPTDGALLVRLKSIIEKDVTFDFYNTVGSKVYSQTQRVQKGENELFFEVTKLPTGVYFIQTSEWGDKNAATKFVKY
jgi:uncharacterized repeat protein (TIGR01451 family)